MYMQSEIRDGITYQFLIKVKDLHHWSLQLIVISSRTLREMSLLIHAEIRLKL